MIKFIFLIFVVLAVGSYYEIKEYKSKCLVIDKTDATVVYNPAMGGSFTQVPPTVTYQCSDGRIFTK